MKREQGLVILSILALVALEMMVGGSQAAVGMPPESAPLIRHFYKVHNTCANVEPFVRHQVQLIWANDKTVAPKLIKLLYADCMVNVRSLSLSQHIIIILVTNLAFFLQFNACMYMYIYTYICFYVYFLYIYICMMYVNI